MEFHDFISHARKHRHSIPPELQEQLAAGQRPTAFFITCADSRVMPATITGAEPGTLFELRTAGNVVPPYAPDSASSEMATIEFAVLQLKVPNIVVCGHSHCGAVGALQAAGRSLEHLPALREWLTKHAGEPRLTTTSQEIDPALREEGQRHLLAQIRTLGEYPFIAERVAAGELAIHGWFYNVSTGEVSTYDTAGAQPGFRRL